MEVSFATMCMSNETIHTLSSVSRADEYFASSQEKAPEKIPMMYVSFPSAKDPNAKDRIPGKELQGV